MLFIGNGGLYGAKFGVVMVQVCFYCGDMKERYNLTNEEVL